jgi:hypothetical protein
MYTCIEGGKRQLFVFTFLKREYPGVIVGRYKKEGKNRGNKWPVFSLIQLSLSDVVLFLPIQHHFILTYSDMYEFIKNKATFKKNSRISFKLKREISY